MAFVPEDFAVPVSLATANFRLEPLGPQHNERDHAAWMLSIDHIKSTPGFDGRDWPAAMSLDANHGDLVAHAKDFDERTGFTYSIVDGADVIGCLYIYPSRDDSHDADVRSWVTAARGEFDAEVWSAVTDWLATMWPFTNPNYAPRK